MLDKLRFFRDRDRHKTGKEQQPGQQPEAVPDPLTVTGVGSRKHHTASRSQHHSRSAGRHHIVQPGPYHAVDGAQSAYAIQPPQQQHQTQRATSYASHIPTVQHSQNQQNSNIQLKQQQQQGLVSRAASTSSGSSRQFARASANPSGGRPGSCGIPQNPPSINHPQQQQAPHHSIPNPSKQHKLSRSSRASSSSGTAKSMANNGNLTGESLKYSSIPLPTGLQPVVTSVEASGQPHRNSVATQSSRHDRHRARELYNSVNASQAASEAKKLPQTSSVSTSTGSVSRSVPSSSKLAHSATASAELKRSPMPSATQLPGPPNSLSIPASSGIKEKVSVGCGPAQPTEFEVKQVSVGCETKQLSAASAESSGKHFVSKSATSATSSTGREARAKSEGVGGLTSSQAALKLEVGGVQLSERLRERIEKAQLSQQKQFTGSPARSCGSNSRPAAGVGSSPYSYLKLSSGVGQLVRQQGPDASGYASDYDPQARNAGDYASDGGYMSESGIGSCARRMQQRFREGMQAVQEYNLKATSSSAQKEGTFGYDADQQEVDGEDSNSVSSGEISDAVAELEKDESLLKSNTSGASANSAASAAASIRQQLRQRQQIHQQGFASSFQSMPIGRTLLNRSRVSPSAASVAAAASDQYSSTLRRYGALSDAETSDPTDDYGSLNFRRGDSAFDGLGSDANCYFSDTEMIGAAACDSYGSQQRSMLARLYPAEQADGIRLAAGQAPAAPPSDLLGSEILGKSARHARSLSASKQLASPVRDVSPASSLSNIRLPYSPVKSSNSTGCFQQHPVSSATPAAVSAVDSKETRGSSLSLYSNHSNLSSMSANEERQLFEIQKLRRELEQAHERVSTLTSQLSTNTHVVSAFENSLSGMTAKLQHLAATAQKKDSELNQLRSTVEELRRQSLAAAAAAVQQEHSASPASPEASAKSGKRHWLRESFGKALKSSGAVSRKSKSSASSTGTPASNRGSVSDFDEPCGHMPSESPSAFSANQLKRQLEEKELKLSDLQTEALNSAHQLEQLQNLMSRMKAEMSALKADNSRLQSVFPANPEHSSPQQHLQQQQQAQHQQQQVSLSKRLSLDSGTASIGSAYSAAGGFDLIFGYSGSEDSKRVTVTVCSADNDSGPATPIGCLPVGSRTKWETMDAYAKRLFKEYVMRIDPMASLGLNGESIASYRLGQVTRCRDQPEPEVRPHVCADDPGGLQLLLRSCSTGGHIDALAFETLIPKAILQRYISLLLEHRKIILCGPCGTGKTFLAQKLAEYIVKREGAASSAVAMFVVDHKSDKELRSYLNSIADEKSGSGTPLVIILDNLHHVNPLSEVLNSYLSSKSPYIIGTMNQAGCSSDRLHAAKLQLHNTCNFRWVLCANHMEPVKGFLGRYLRRKLLNSEVMERAYKPEAARIVDWIPSVWQHLNKFLETHSSSEVTIGPRQFLSCPVSTEESQLWFADLWNYSLVPYLLEACREGLQTYGRRAPWEDPTEWIMATWPWEFSPAVDLIRLRPEDVGYETHPALSATSPLRQQQQQQQPTAAASVSEDPLMSMLLRLQAAANFGADAAADSDLAGEPVE